jgi:hypothetical protein
VIVRSGRYDDITFEFVRREVEHRGDGANDDASAIHIRYCEDNRKGETRDRGELCASDAKATSRNRKSEDEVYAA